METVLPVPWALGWPSSAVVQEIRAASEAVQLFAEAGIGS
jgi:hypothetical protein